MYKSIIVGFAAIPLILTITGNAIFFITLLKTSSLHTPSNVLLGAMCLTDLLAGVLVQPWSIALIFMNFDPCCPPMLNEYNFVFRLTVINSFIFTLLIALDRFVATCYPYRYMMHATCRKHVYAACSIFVLSVIYGIVELQTFQNSEIILWSLEACMQWLVIIAVLIMYAKIYRVISLYRKRIESIMNSTASQQSTVSRRERSKTYTVAIVLVVFLVCYAPYVAYCIQMALYYSGKGYYSFELSTAVIFLVLLNSCFNPIIYCARSQEIRRAAWRIFNPKSCSGRDLENSMSSDTN